MCEQQHIHKRINIQTHRDLGRHTQKQHPQHLQRKKIDYIKLFYLFS